MLEPPAPTHVKMMTNETAKLYPHDHILKWTILQLIPKWITPNHVTIFRFIATPAVLVLLVLENYVWGVPAFIFVAFTDAIDGSLARTRKQITLWGTFYDPVADKILIGLVILFVVIKYINIWFALAIILIELMIAAGAFYRRAKKTFFVAANGFGKTKMFLQVVGVGALLVSVWFGSVIFMNIALGAFAMAIVFGLISLFTYGI